MVNQKGYRKVLQQQLGPQEGNAILAGQRQRFDQLYSGRTVYANRALRAHTEDHILPGLALYQVLRERGYGQTRALEITQTVLEALAVSGRSAMSWVGKLGIAFPVLRLVVRRIMRQGYPTEGWETEWVEVSSKLVAFNMHRCFYLDTLTAYGAPELAACFCATDDLVYQDLWPDVRWGRTTTLGRGDEKCNFRFEKVERPGAARE